MTKDLLFETFLITVGTNCVVVITQFRVGIIFTTNELVDRIRNFKSNASLFKKKLNEKMRRRPDFL